MSVHIPVPWMVWVTCLAGESLYIILYYKRLFTTSVLFHQPIRILVKKIARKCAPPAGNEVTPARTDTVDGSEIMVTILLCPQMFESSTSMSWLKKRLNQKVEKFV